jgi:hypothetical protein
MIGPKKLAEINRELRRTLRKSKRELEPWLDEQLSKSARANSRSVLEDLLWVRKLLRGAVSEKKSPRKPSTTRR